MPDSVKLSAVLRATPQQVYEAWLSSREHTAFTGDAAAIDPKVGGEYTAGSGYIHGVTLELEPYRHIVQSWHSTDFPDDAEDSRLEITLEETPRGTRLTLAHTNIPDGQGTMYRDGWREFYLTPMRVYFSSKGQA